MNDTKISGIQLALLIIGFTFGSTAIMNPSYGAGQDAWLAFILGFIGGTTLLGIYVAIAHLNPGKNLYEILESFFGKYLGRGIGLLYVWYFIHLASLVLRNFGEFTFNSKSQGLSS